MRTPEIRPGIRRFFRLAAKHDPQAEADDEIRLHLQLRTDRLIRDGLSPEAARAEAERRFGSVDAERARFRSSAQRREERMRVREWIDSVSQDVRYAVRTLRRDATFTVFALAIIGLGIGASATVFSLVDGVLLRPMPFREPARLIWIANIADDGIAEWRLQVDHFLDLGARSHSLESMAGYFAYYGTGNAVLARAGETQRLTQVPVTCNFLPFLGVKPLIGRSFSADECLFGASPTVLLTEANWRQRFASDPAIVGRTLTVNDAPATVIGVLPASFDFNSIFAPGSVVDFLTPFPLTEETNRQGNSLAAIGRLKPNVSIETARSELVALGKGLTAEFPRRNTIRPRVLPLDQRINGHVRPALLMLAGAVVVVMLIVTANLSSLQYARMSSRQRELAVRLALGAGRGRLIRQALTESLVLTCGGAVIGLMLAVAGTRFVSHLGAFDIPLLARMTVDARVLSIVVLVAVLTGVLVGVLPALHAPADVHEALKDNARGSTRGGRHARVRSVLVVVEVAAACVLLVASGLLVRSFMRVLDVDLGFHPEHTATLRVDPAKRFDDMATANAFYADVLRRVRAVPGVTHAGLADLLPFAGDRSWGVAGVGQVYARDQYPEAFIRVVSPGYFQAMGISLRAGRAFGDGDVPGQDPVVVVNETLARTLWPGRDPIGQAISRQPTPLRVVGVVADVRHDALEHAFTNELYYPMTQFADHSAVNLVVRTNLPSASLATSVRAALMPIAPEATKNQWRMLQELVDKVASPRRFVVMLLMGFAGFALVLAALGIYALISYGVSQRTQEIGIRLALGASAGNVRAGIMRGTLVLAGAGMAIGVVAAALVVPSLSGMLFGVQWSDPASFAVALALLVIVAAAAGHFPARRASRVDPSVALREA
ncbi:MAG: multidrug transporter substrate-binding protein [Gemmatimonadetes bacterium]|nr:multidrug transporter substrate-binding protein [Gemmatimonadota bacterium]